MKSFQLFLATLGSIVFAASLLACGTADEEGWDEPLPAPPPAQPAPLPSPLPPPAQP